MKNTTQKGKKSTRPKETANEYKGKRKMWGGYKNMGLEKMKLLRGESKPHVNGAFQKEGSMGPVEPPRGLPR